MTHFPKTEAGSCLKHSFSSSCIMAFAGIVDNDAQKEDMAVSLAVLLLKDGEKEVSVSPACAPAKAAEPNCAPQYDANHVCHNCGVNGSRACRAVPVGLESRNPLVPRSGIAPFPASCWRSFSASL